MESEAKKVAKELAAQAGTNYLIFIEKNGHRHVEADITTEAFIDFVKKTYKCFNRTARMMIAVSLKAFFLIGQKYE